MAAASVDIGISDITILHNEIANVVGPVKVVNKGKAVRGCRHLRKGDTQ